MYSSYLNIITFLITTIVYYFALKPTLTYDIYSQTEQFKKYTQKSHLHLAIYISAVILVQFIINSYQISTQCGGSVSDNIAIAGIYTFLPWFFIFGPVVVLLLTYPSIKRAFSDVIGYFYISNTANTVLNDLLIDKNIQDKIDNDKTLTAEKKQALENSASAIIRIFGNTSILINQIVPENFLQYWNILQPLMKPQYQENNSDIKTRFFDAVVSRDNVGEAMWFIYTGIILTAIIQMKLTTKGCTTNSKTMEKNYQQFLDQENKAKAESEKVTSTSYQITG
jgi:hypothetical protein